MVNYLAGFGVHHKTGKQNITTGYAVEDNDRAAGKNTHTYNIAIVFSVRRVAVSIKDFSINVRVNFDNPALNFEHLTLPPKTVPVAIGVPA